MSHLYYCLWHCHNSRIVSLWESWPIAALLRSNHRFSILLRSGECEGHRKTFILHLLLNVWCWLPFHEGHIFAGAVEQLNTRRCQIFLEVSCSRSGILRGFDSSTTLRAVSMLWMLIFLDLILTSTAPFYISFLNNIVNWGNGHQEAARYFLIVSSCLMIFIFKVLDSCLEEPRAADCWDETEGRFEIWIRWPLLMTVNRPWPLQANEGPIPRSKSSGRSTLDGVFE